MTRIEDPPERGDGSRIWIGKLTLTDFRNYRAATLVTGPDPVVLTGANGAGKTNCLEAISLLTAGRGLRSLPFPELARSGGSGSWAVAARVFTGGEETQIGTGVQLPPDGVLGVRAPRIVKIDGAAAKGSGALARIRMLWLTPAMDSLFTGPASERRRFIDRLALSLEPSYASAAATFDRAMRQRNKALEAFSPPRLLDSIEVQMADTAVILAAARHRAIQSLGSGIIDERDRDPDSVFPWAGLTLQGHLEGQIDQSAPNGLPDAYRTLLAQSRDRDRAAGRALTGPHRSDLEVIPGPQNMPAKMCSTGEQKALLAGLVLAQARLVMKTSGGIAPLILLDEIAAHLDSGRRLALFSSIASLGAQVWMTGTDAGTFAPLSDVSAAQFFLVSNGAFVHAADAKSGSRH
ncbi:MAG: DNA replication/repair protein RecF [Rhodomicrobium sp.]|nr:DNA replication/repair protein RecF [Rhodomicrobium sp.]